MAQGNRQTPYRAGVSLMALLRRNPGPIVPRQKPSDAAADYYDPAAELVTAEA